MISVMSAPGAACWIRGGLHPDDRSSSGIGWPPRFRMRPGNVQAASAIEHGGTDGSRTW